MNANSKPRREEWLNALLGPSNRFSLEDRALNAVLLCSVIISIAALINDSLEMLGSHSWTTSSASALLVTILYALSRLGVRHNIVFWIFIAFHCALIAGLWLLAEGMTDDAALLIMVFICVIPALASGRQAVLAILCIGLVLAGLHTHELSRLKTATGDGVEIERRLNMLFTIVMFGCGAALAVYFVVWSFRREHAAALRLNKKLEVASFEIVDRNIELKRMLEEVKVLRGIIPICSHCKKIRNDEGYYEAIEKYISRHSEADFSHGLCHDCVHELYPEIAGEIIADSERDPDDTA